MAGRYREVETIKHKCEAIGSMAMDRCREYTHATQKRQQTAPQRQSSFATTCLFPTPERHAMHHAQHIFSSSSNKKNLLLVLVVLILSLHRGLGNSVQITLSALCDATAALVLVVLEHADLLERLHGLAVDGSGGVDVVVGAHTAVLGATVDLAETADTDGLAHVDVTGDGGGADVEPGG